MTKSPDNSSLPAGSTLLDADRSEFFNLPVVGNASVIFGVIADSGQIKQRKNGSYQMVLKGVDKIDWLTDRPYRSGGLWKPQKLVRQWDQYFASSEPNAQVTVEVGEQRKLFAFEMFKPKIKSGKMMFNIKPLSDSSEDKIIGVIGKGMDKVSVFIDDAADTSSCDLSGARLSGANLSDANLSGAGLANANLTDVNLTGANLNKADLYRSTLTGANLTGANLSGAVLVGANLVGATYDSTTTWPTAEYWNNTTCPDGTNSDNNPSCGF